MRVIDFLKKHNIAYKAFYYLCQHVGVKAPNINSKLSSELIYRLELNLKSDEFISYYKNEKIKFKGSEEKLRAENQKSTAIIENFINQNNYTSDEDFYKVINAIKYKFSISYYSLKQKNIITKLLRENTTLQDKFKALKENEIFKKTTIADLLNELSQQSEDTYGTNNPCTEEMIMRAIQNGNGEAFGFG